MNIIVGEEFLLFQKPRPDQYNSPTLLYVPPCLMLRNLHLWNTLHLCILY